MRNAADRAVSLANQTPHRVMRELYEQFIAYGRAYADSIPNYTPADDFWAGANISATSALGAICDAIDYGSAVNRAPTVQPGDPASTVATPSNPNHPQRFLAKPDPSCSGWVQQADKFDADMTEWAKLDVSIPASQWSPQQERIQSLSAPVIASFAENGVTIGRQSNNPIFTDFADLAAVYFRAYVNSLKTYTPPDNYLVLVGLRVNNLLTNACRTVE
jgi:hypothetical protein